MPDPVTLGVLGKVGFTAVGIAKGSIAAGAQSVIYGGATQGAFSAVTSYTMGGAGGGLLMTVGAPVVVVGGATAAVGAGAYYGYNYYTKKQQ